MKTSILGLAITGFFGFSAIGHAEEGNWMVRVRAVHLGTANQSDAIPSLAVPEDAIHVSDKTIPEFDVSYFFTPNIAAELVLTYPQRHDVEVTQSAIGAFDAGSFKHLPPTLMLQYHFLPDHTFRPYIGVGMNYTRISSVHLSVPGVTDLHLENDSFGAALQVGFDVKLNERMFLNVDLKKIYIDTDVENDAGARVSAVDVNPLAFAVGLGWRF